MVWITQIAERIATPFQLVDDDGVAAWVGPEHLVISLPLEDVNEDPHVNDENDAFCSYLRTRGVAPTAYMGIAREHLFRERALLVGDTVSVCGHVAKRTRQAEAGYRDAVVEELYFEATPGAPVFVLS